MPAGPARDMRENTQRKVKCIVGVPEGLLTEVRAFHHANVREIDNLSHAFRHLVSVALDHIHESDGKTLANNLVDLPNGPYLTRREILMPAQLQDKVREYRFKHPDHAGSDAEAVRQLVWIGLRRSRELSS